MRGRQSQLVGKYKGEKAGKSRHDRGDGRLDRLKAGQGRSTRQVGRVEWSVGAEVRPGKGFLKNKRTKWGKFGQLRVSWEGDVWKRGEVDDKVGAVCGV